MEREIKFRCWDAKGTFVTDEGLLPEGKGHMKCNVGVSVSVSRLTGKKQWHTGIDGLHVPDDDPNLPIMQFTGLKDKNGKEIYEGDIVKNMTHGKGVANYEIKWGNVGFYGVSKDGDKYGPYTLNLFINDKYPVLEVIGNIYENPELLNS